ncbi:RES family NAD+ phosphorylase [Knoellia koreensis]|jgi:RES domain-containing protein|uniref:RES domain-containing protein n=1 Tax=Knoellia koreensis TaxID=2730921 RepID=A0A849HIC3_9MICO|nr:RES domain-containing protein [Knoellia sp. DB2414S]NNM46949.1 RES domain-containing protein [Knoellia sp. DB2414S]
MPLDDELVQRVDQLGASAWSGTTYRYTTARRDPLSGAGARLNGGRWNPPDIFATIYLATPIETCLAELERLAVSQNNTAAELLRVPYKLHTVKVTNLAILDLRDASALAHVGIGEADIADDDWTACQAVGHAAWFLGLSGVLAPSASGAGHVLAAFETRTGPSLEVTASVPLTPDRLVHRSDGAS